MPNAKRPIFIASDMLEHSFSFNTRNELRTISLVCKEFQRIIGNSDYYWQEKIKDQLSSDLTRMTQGFDNPKEAFIFHSNKLHILIMDLNNGTAFFDALAQIKQARPHYEQGLFKQAIKKFDSYIHATKDIIQLLKIFPDRWQAIIKRLATSPNLGNLINTPSALTQFATAVAYHDSITSVSYLQRLEIISALLLPRVLTTSVFNRIYESSYDFIKLLPILTEITKPLYVEKILTTATLLRNFLDNEFYYSQLLQGLGEDYRSVLAPEKLRASLAKIQLENSVGVTCSY